MYQLPRNPTWAFWGREGNLPRQDCHPMGARAALGHTAWEVGSWYAFWGPGGKVCMDPTSVMCGLGGFFREG